MQSLTTQSPNDHMNAMSPRERSKVLIVDDDRDLLDMIGLFVEIEGYETELVADGEAALEAIKNDPPDLMVLDLVMPGLGGFEVIERLRTLAPDLYLPVIMVTAQEERALHVQALQSGVVDYIQKPVDFAVLSARIRAALMESRIQNKLVEANARLEAIVATRTRQLEVKNEYLTAVLDNAKDGIIGCDENGLPAIFNRKASEMLGIENSLSMLMPYLTTNEMFQSDGSTPLGPESNPLREAFEKETLEDADIILERYGANPRLVNATGSAVHDKSGLKIGAVIALRDVTEQKQLEKQIHQIRKRYEKMLDSVPMPLHITDKNGMILEANDLWLEAFGYDRKQVQGSYLGDYLTIQFKHLASEPVRAAMINMGHTQDVKCQIRHADGREINASLVSQAVYDEKGDLNQIVEYVTKVDDPSGS